MCYLLAFHRNLKHWHQSAGPLPQAEQRGESIMIKRLLVVITGLVISMTATSCASMRLVVLGSEGDPRLVFAPLVSDVAEGVWLDQADGRWTLVTRNPKVAPYTLDLKGQWLTGSVDGYRFVTKDAFAGRRLRAVYLYTVDDGPRQWWLKTRDGITIFEVTVNPNPYQGTVALLPVSDGGEYWCNYTGGGGDIDYKVPNTGYERGPNGFQYACLGKIDVYGARKWQDPDKAPQFIYRRR